MARIDTTASLWKVEQYLATNGPSYPSHIAVDIGAMIGDVVRAITYLERQKKLTRYVGGKFGILDPAIGCVEMKTHAPIEGSAIKIVGKKRQYVQTKL